MATKKIINPIYNTKATFTVTSMFATLILLVWALFANNHSLVQNVFFAIGIRIGPISVLALLATHSTFPNKNADEAIGIYRGTKICLFDKIMFALAAILLCTNFVVNRKTYMVVCAISIAVYSLFGFVSAFVLTTVAKNKKTNFGISCFAGTVFILPLIISARYISSIDKPFHDVSAIIAGVFALMIFAILWLYKLNFKKDAYPLTFAALVFMIFFALSLTSSDSLNYAFDTSSPTVKQCIITDKEISNGRKSTSYYLILDVDGQELKAYVDKNVYYNKEKGETYAINLYDGAFNVPYFLPKEVDIAFSK